MKKIVVVVLLILSGSIYNLYSQPYRWIVPGTMSHRLSTSTTTDVDLTHLYRGHYFGYPGGGLTNFNSSQYKEFALFEHPSNATWYQQPSDVDMLPENQFKRFQMNFRMLYPTAFDSTDFSVKYPVLLMMHGAGERGDCWPGRGPNFCFSNETPPRRYLNNDINVRHGGRVQMDAVNASPSSNRHWPGFVVVPQNENGWNPGRSLERVFAMLELLPDYYPIDKNRIYVHGLSNGADGTWMLLNTRPDLFAAAAPMSGFANNTAISNKDIVGVDTTVIHIPLRQTQGGNDGNPRPSATEQKMQQLRNAGGTPEYVLYEGVGHGTWGRAYNESDFFSWFLQYSKLTIHSFYGVTDVCEGDDVAVRLGISPGFDNYEWQKIIGTDTTSFPGVVDWPNEIIADEIGSYRVRFARGTEWTEWSEPYTIGSKPRPTTSIVSDPSVALPGLPGLDSTDHVTLSAIDQNAIFYEWYKDDVLVSSDSSLINFDASQQGKYQLVTTSSDLCKSFPSNPIYVSERPYVGILPDAPTDLTVIPNSPNTASLFWTDNAQNELGYDIYRSRNGSDNFEWITALGANAISYVDNSLQSNRVYSYRVRAFSEDGASNPTAKVTITTPVDSQPPTVPGDLVVEGFNYDINETNVADGLSDENFLVNLDEIILKWSPSTDDVAIDGYDIYMSDGTLVNTTSDTSFIITGLAEDQQHAFYVVSRDLEGNTSHPSNQATITTTLNGVMYNLYDNGETYNLIRGFSDDVEDFSGIIENFDIGFINGLVGESDPIYVAIEYFGYLYIDQAGSYTFRTTSDDGSRLWIGTDMLVNNDGRHGAVTVTSSATNLAVGRQPITVQFFEATGAQTLTVEYRGPDTGNSWIPIPDAALRSSNHNLPTVPAVPTGLSATPSGSDLEVSLSWSHSDASNVKFEIFRKEDGLPENAYAIVHTTDLGEVSHIDTGLDANQLYDYKVRAINDNGASDFSGVSSAQTIADTENPSVPTSLTVQSFNENSVAMSWSPSTDNVGVVSYVVYEGGAPTGGSSGRKRSSLGRISGTTSGTSIVIGDLDPDTDYSFTVAAEDASGNNSGESSPVNVTTSSSGPLPVNFINFFATNENNSVLLTWTTASEINNERFEIERAFDPTEFETIGALDGSGTTTEIKQYNFRDVQPTNIAYYRVRQVDFDGESSYSNVIRVVFNSSGLEKLRVFPNPTDANNINIKGFVPTENTTVRVQLLDVLGQVHFEELMEPNRILEGIEVRTSQLLPPGIYVISITDGLKESTQAKLLIR
ncbi:MAG: fibronectin type III domain-containing protein [Bacteroidota bacterium]